MRKSTESLSSAYNPKEVEPKWYAFWEKEGYFSPEGAVKPGTVPYVIVIPPPNVTGSLHMGHALNNTLQDALIRFKRMQGYRALWLPGTDHAGIPTQMLVERELKKEGTTRHDIGRDALIERVWEWKEKYGDIIINQLKQLGCSCDWTRTRFTMDEGYTKAVQEAFIHLYRKGFIYKGNRIINWCVTCQTAVSDLEIMYRETKGKLYYFRYPLAPGTGVEYIVIATTRPETMLGDTAVAVNPEDERYAKLLGMKIRLPLMEREIPLVSDSFVDKAFGTGAVKITPFHDPNDFEAGLRHQLPSVQVIGFNGKMTQEAGKYAGMKRYDCREQILKDLEEKGLIEKIEDYTHSLSCHDRCGDVLEPLVSLQWFVRMKELAEPAISCVKDGRVKFHPERFSKTYLDWMENIKDWCISRQIWWGHRIPVWYCEKQGTGDRGQGAGKEENKNQPLHAAPCTLPPDDLCKPVASAVKPDKCPSCGSANFTQDEDVLDTWFSSALWPFATLGWPNETSDVKNFYPTATLSTARDIINLWVARMIMSGLEFMGEAPFKDVYIHPTILNEQGKRMSKSLGTGVDPLELMEKYGTDATRFGLILNCTKGQDVRFSERMIENTRNFCTKLWNASRFVMMNLEDRQPGTGNREQEGITRREQLQNLKLETLNLKPETLSVTDRWILSRCNKTIRDVTGHLDKFNFHEACQALYEFLWGDFCDWYLEIAKIDLYKDEAQRHKGAEAHSPSAHELDERKNVVQSILHDVLSTTLKLLHPFLPFITEEIYALLNPEEKSIMIAAWPVADERLFDEDAENEMKIVQNIVSTLRSLRHELSISPSEKVEANIVQPDSAGAETFKKAEQNSGVVKFLAKLKQFSHDGKTEKDGARFLSSLVDGILVSIPIPENFNIKSAIQKLEKEKTKLEQEAEKLKKRLTDEAFLKGAPPHVLESEKGKAQNYEKQFAHINERLRQFKSFEVKS